jgi:hypothetical protein
MGRHRLRLERSNGPLEPVGCPAIPGQHLRRSGEEGFVEAAQPWPPGSPSEHLYLMLKNENLDLAVRITTAGK